MNLFEEQEPIEVEEPVEFATQADEHFMNWDQEQAYVKACTEKVNIFYWPKHLKERFAK
ncbi:hypothetical protein [Exiguobacterium sp. s21]|uniref:hypothetical protein n=1 Tax=Exiguobacterium sp. s21 TaxID=2751244 RepID=UPI001BECB126|nr:hypothetical protein [Exiguobacterium sp. s21]